MAKTLAIKVKYSSEGEGKVIKNINELESAIEQLSTELKTLDFGTEEYQKTAAELNRLKSEFKDIEKTVEGLDTEAKLSALGGALEVVSGSFLIASSAARTFGASAESVEEIEALEQQALEAVNIALGVRAISEGLVQAAKLKSIAVEKIGILQTNLSTAAQTAYAAVVGTSTGALKAFRIALASTGIGLIVVAVGALVANWDKLTAAIFGSNEEADRFNEINKEAQKSIAKTNVELDFYAGIVNDVTKSENERLEALDELNKLGVITEDITLDQADALEILNERLEITRENILLKAQSEAAASLLSEAFKNQIEAQSTSLEDNVSWWDTVVNSVLSAGNAYVFASRQAQTAAQNQVEALEETTSEVEKYEEIYLGILEKLNENEAKLRKERETADKNREKRNKDKEERNKIDSEYTKIIQQLTDNLKQATSATKTLATATRDEVAIVQKLTDIRDKQNELLKERLELLGDETGLTKEQVELNTQLDRLVGGLVIPKEGIKSIEDFTDIFAKLLGVTTEAAEVTSSAASSPVEALREEAEETGEELNRLLDIQQRLSKIPPTEFFTEEQQTILIDYFQKQVQIQDKADEYNVTLQELIDKQELVRESLQKQLDLGQITTEEYNEQIANLEKIVDLNRNNVAQNVDYERLVQQIFKIQEEQFENRQSTAEIDEMILQTISEQVFGISDINNLTVEQRNLVDELNTDLRDQTKIYKDTKEAGEALLKLQQEITKNADEQSKKFSEAQFEQLQLFIKSNESRIGEVQAFFNKLKSENSNLTKQQIEDIQRLIDGIAFNKKFEEIQEFAGRIIDEFNALASGIQNVLASSISLQLEQLAYYEEQELARIGDETERAKEIQEETRQEIAKQRFDLEKKARLQELGFSLAGGIANTAQAILKALATVPPPGGQILAGVYGGIGAAQTAIILDQINFVKSTEFIGRRGGLIMGNDHENGGVMMNGGLVLEGGEAVLNKNAVAQFSDLLSQINIQTGGRALSVDDSALVQEIRKQNQNPIKTYVLYNDIQDTNKINSRLEQISRL